jgi:hypothetical protein
VGIFSRSLAPVPPEPPKALRAPAPRATLDAEIRAVIYQHMGRIGELAAATGVPASNLSDWIFGDRSRLTPLQVEAVARAVGVLTTPVSGLAVIRAALEVRLSQSPVDWGPSRLNRVPDIGTTQDEENPSSAAHAARLRRFVDYGEIDSETLQGFVAVRWGPAAYYDPETDAICMRDTAEPMGPPPPRHRGGSNVPTMNQMAIATYKRLIADLEAREAARQG